MSTPTPPTRPSAPRVRKAPPLTLLRRGLVKHCPRCGAGKLFRHWTKMVEDCPRCGLHFEREEGFFLGAVVINVILTELVIIIAIAVGFGVTLPHPPTVKLAIIAGVAGALMPLLVYPFTKTTWCAVDMIMRRGLGESYRNVNQPGFTPRREDGAPPRPAADPTGDGERGEP